MSELLAFSTRNLDVLTNHLTVELLAAVVFTTLLMWVGGWKTFNRAGHHGWTFVLPVLNYYVMCDVADVSKLWSVAALIPVVNLFVVIYIHYGVSREFGHGVIYTLGLTFLPFLFWPILGYGGKYRGKKGWNNDLVETR